MPIVDHAGASLYWEARGDGEPLLLIAGWYSRIGAWLIAVNMLFAFGLAHGGELFAIDPESGALVLEKQYMFFFAAIALGLLGPGRYAFNQK